MLVDVKSSHDNNFTGPIRNTSEESALMMCYRDISLLMQLSDAIEIIINDDFIS